MVNTRDLAAYLDGLLEIEQFQDYCPNGLQVEGRAQTGHIVGGVTASQALIEAAVAQQADTLLVHHGFFWRGEAPQIIGMKQRRIKALLDAGINLLAYHLPLDAHPQFGNNTQLGRHLAITPDPANPDAPSTALLHTGRLEPSRSLDEFAHQVEAKLARRPLCIAGGDHPIQTIAWCTGAAQSYIEQAIDLGVDAFLSGEVSEPTVHMARENNIHYIAAGHHATERYGVQSLGKHLIEKYQIDFTFIDIDNPV